MSGNTCLSRDIPKVRQSSNLKLKLSGTTIHEDEELLCPPQYAGPFGAEVHEQMSRFGKKPSGFNNLPEVYFSETENITEFLEGIDNQIKLLEKPSDLSWAYLKGHLLGRAQDWYQIFESALVQNTAKDFLQLKVANAEIGVRETLVIPTGLFADKPGLTHVLCHEIDTGDKPPVISRPFLYDRVKQAILDYHVDKRLKEGTIIPI
ncbi:uncharacterized protein TNCV_3853491 [Trichonephila clavipes]|nr:uncharacterized protein TNCV_3853491 [Trichonephila clavipes]